MNVSMERRQKRILSEIRQMQKDMRAMQIAVAEILSLQARPKYKNVWLNNYILPHIPEKAIFKYFADKVFQLEHIEQYIEDMVKIIYIDVHENHSILYSSDLHIAYVYTDKGVLLEKGDNVINTVSYRLLEVIMRLFKEKKLPESFVESFTNQWGHYMAFYTQRNNTITRLLNKASHDEGGEIRNTWLVFFPERYFNFINYEKLHHIHEKIASVSE